MKYLNLFIISCVFIFSINTVYGAPKYNKGTSKNGVIAYQDHEDPEQFFYIPSSNEAVLGESLKEFKATYWGIGPRHMAQFGDTYKSVVGAVIAARASIDISPAQRDAITKEIKKVYGIDPKLLPLSLTNVKVQPVIASSTMALGAGAEIVFPSSINFGTTFAFTMGSGSSLFAQIVAIKQASSDIITPNPQFAVNIVGDAEFVGDPWKCKVECDLSKVWKRIRTTAGGNARIGWWKVSRANYDKLIEDMKDSGDCKFDMEEGSLENEKYGRQIFEMGKEIFKEINSLAIKGEGFFKFEPAPESASFYGGWWPWNVSVNLSRSERHFNQRKVWKTTISYTGRFKRPVPASMSLAVNCNSSTSRYFTDLGNAGQPCITQDKINTFNSRVGAESAAKNTKLLNLEERLILGEITQEQFDRLYDLYSNISFTEDMLAHSFVDGVIGDVDVGLRTINNEDILNLEEKALQSLK